MLLEALAVPPIWHLLRPALVLLVRSQSAPGSARRLLEAQELFAQRKSTGFMSGLREWDSLH